MAGRQFVCEGPDDDGCYGWVGPAICPTGSVCSPAFGECTVGTGTECDELNECLYVGQKICMTEVKYRACKVGETGCLEWDCST